MPLQPSSSSSGTGTGPGTTGTGSTGAITSRSQPPPQSQFTFVTGNIQSEARSHAMREHWKRRHKHNQEVKTSIWKKTSTSSSRTLLPRSPSASTGEEDRGGRSSATATSSSGQRYDKDGGKGKERERDADSSPGKRKYSQPGIPGQMFSGLSFALSSARPDPFQTCPVHLTSQHQKLLHHWISMHAAMMFEDLDVTEFNPMKDVWFPLDLSNASSFNCIIAHSAAHLSHLYIGTPPQQGTNSSDALKYKIEAVRILRVWLSDPEKELCDYAFAAAVRLLTFERYWGTVADWKIHRDGLQRMIDAKGGVEALHDNWRLELVIYLVSLMSKPSWLESTNNLERISRPLYSPSIRQPALCLDIQKVRCLWLISFVQDLRTFRGSFHTRGLFGYPITYTAVGLLFQKFQHSIKASSPGGEDIMEWEDEMLCCLFSISILIQESISGSSDGGLTIPPSPDRLGELEIFLQDSKHIWMNSVSNLCVILFESLLRLFQEGEFKVNYVMDLVQVLNALSFEARQGVEKCLLNLLYCLGKNNTTTLIDDRWTPDSLLSSMHGR